MLGSNLDKNALFLSWLELIKNVFFTISKGEEFLDYFDIWFFKFCEAIQ